MESYIGEIQLFPYNYAPIGWLECKGQVVNIVSNNALFSLLGARFGGDGTSTFALPDMRGMEPTKDLRYYIATSGYYPVHDGGSNEDFIGEIKLFPYNFDPSGYIRCDGRILNISEYDALFALIGTTYGGNGITTFKLPDMRSMEPNEYTRYCINPYGVFPSQS
jgi:microcystin-dependent protein